MKYDREKVIEEIINRLDVDDHEIKPRVDPNAFEPRLDLYSGDKYLCTMPNPDDLIHTFNVHNKGDGNVMNWMNLAIPITEDVVELAIVEITGMLQQEIDLKL